MYRQYCSANISACQYSFLPSLTMIPHTNRNCAEVKISNDCSSSAPTPAPVDTRWYVKLTSCLNDGQHYSYDRKYDTLGECCTNGLGWIYDACMSAATGSVESTGSPTSAPIPSTPEPSKAPITIGPSKSPTNSPVTPEVSLLLHYQKV